MQIAIRNLCRQADLTLAKEPGEDHLEVVSQKVQYTIVGCLNWVMIMPERHHLERQ
jgi:hypothetical protein